MDIAVIIPVFNGEKYLRRTLQSVCSQTLPPREIIAVDDGSTDGSLDIIKAFPRVTLLRNPKKGANAARRWGIQQSTADGIALLDQDDIWHPSHLQLLNQALDQLPRCPAAFGDCVHFYSDRQRLFSAPTEKFQQFDPWKVFPSNSIATPSTALIERSALSKIGGWPVHLMGCADVYTWYCLGIDAPLARSLSTTVGYRQHRTSMSVDLRSQKFRTYLDNRSAAMADALNHRMKVNPASVQTLQQRLQAFQIIPRIVETMVNGEREQLQQAAFDFEASLANEPDGFIRSMGNLLLFYLCPLLVQKSMLDCLLASWPAAQSQTRKLLFQKLVATRVFLKQLATHPLDRMLWSTLLENNTLLHQKFVQYFSRSL